MIPSMSTADPYSMGVLMHVRIQQMSVATQRRMTETGRQTVPKVYNDYDCMFLQQSVGL